MTAPAFVCRTDIPCIAPSPPHRRFRLSGPPPFAVPPLSLPRPHSVTAALSAPAPVPPPPPDKVRHNEGAEFRSCLFLSHSDALCPKAGTGIGHGTVPEILSEPP